MADHTPGIRPVCELPKWAYMRLRSRVPALQGHATTDLGWEFACRLAEDPKLPNNRELLDLAHDLRCAIEVLTDVHWNRFSRTCARNGITAALPLLARLRAEAGNNTELAFVDLGAGPWNPYAISFLALAGGADRAWGFDLESPHNPARAVRALAELAAALLVDPASLLGKYAVPAHTVLDRLRGFDLARLARGDAAGIDGQRLRFEHRNAADLGLPEGSVAVMRSEAFLEHIDSVDAVIAEMARVTRRGGYGIHHIDAIDHRSYMSPKHGALDYLCHPEPGEVVALPMEGQRPYVMNRLRPHEWVGRFEAHGFRVEWFEPIRPVPLDDAARARFVEPYRSMTLEQLAPTAGNYRVVRT